MFASGWLAFKTINYKYHLLFAFLLRVLFIWIGVYHDSYATVPYTDIDYKVFTDASHHVLNGRSPYDRHTYRYTPLIAILLTPNLFLHHTFGKLLFSLIDVFVGLLIRLIVKNTLREYECFKQKTETKTIRNNPEVNESGDGNSQEKQWNRKHNVRQRKKVKQEVKVDANVKQSNEVEIAANISMFVYVYNPMTVAIATRGNGDSIAGFLVLATLYFIQCKRSSFVAGLVHGTSVHLRLYPIAYSLALFFYLSKYSFYLTDNRKKDKTAAGITNKKSKNASNKILQDTQVILRESIENRKTIFNKQYILYLVPNGEQLKLIFGCLLSLASLTALFYYFYGYKFLYETYIYHLVRKDTRHNFSVYFYLQYLTAGIKNVGLWQKVLVVLPQVILLLVFSVRYGLNKFCLNFSILTQTIVMVTFNSVLTSQYFVWILAVLPLSIWQVKMSMQAVLICIFTWILAQGAWLLPAYFLEFHGQNTFMLIWIQGVAFFCANMGILGRLIMNFMPR